MFPDPDGPITSILYGHFFFSFLLLSFVVASKLNILETSKLNNVTRMSFWDTKELFQKLPFHNTFIEKAKIKHLSNIELLHELPFFDELSVVKISNAFRTYARSYKVEIVDSKDPLTHLEATKSRIRNLLKDFLNEKF